MSRILRWHCDLVARFPRRTLLAVALVTAALSSGLPQLRTEVAIDETELPSTEKQVRDCLDIEEVFGASNMVTVVLETRSSQAQIFDASVLSSVKRLSDALARNRDLVPADVTSLTEASDVSFADGAVDSREAVSFPLTPAGLKKVRQQVLSHPLWAGRLVDREGRQATIITASTATGASVDRLYDSLQRLTTTVPTSTRAMVTGGDILPVAMTRAIDSDMQLFVPLALLLVAIGFFISFRTLGGVLIPFSVTVLAMIWLLGLMGLVGLPLNPVTTVLPPTLVALGSSYGVHFMNRLYAAAGEDQPTDHRSRSLDVTRSVSKPLLVAGATTALGMATLLTFEIKMIRQFGLLMAVGILFVVVLTLTFVPAVCALVKFRPSQGATRWLAPLLGRLGGACRRHAKPIAVGTVIAAAVLLGLASNLDVGIDLASYFPPEHPQRRANDLISDKLGGAANAMLMVEVDPKVYADGSRSPKLLSQLMSFEQRLRKIPGVGHVESLADVVFHVHRRVQSQLAQETGQATDPRARPTTRQQVDQLLLLYAMGAGMQAVDKLEDASHRRLAVGVAIRGWDQAEHRRILAQASEAFNDLFPRGAQLTSGGDVVMMLAFDRYIVRGKLINIGLTVAVVLLICSLIYRSLRRGLIALIPVSFATLATFALMATLGLRLTMATAVITSVAIGVGVDFAVHFLDHYLQHQGGVEGAMRVVGPAVVYDAGSNVLGFAPLALSSLVPVQHFGWLVSLCMIFAALATLIVLPAVLELTATRRERCCEPSRGVMLSPTQEVPTR